MPRLYHHPSLMRDGLIPVYFDAGDGGTHGLALRVNARAFASLKKACAYADDLCQVFNQRLWGHT